MVLASPGGLRFTGQLIAQRYELMGCIGAGGMGEVWEARHRALDAPVAIKFALPPRAAEQGYLERFRREACAMARLRCPHIVQIYDSGVFEGKPYLVMELLEGESLRARLERTRVLTLPEAGALARQLGRALMEIHRRGMVHRDVTPANVFLLTEFGEAEEFRIKLLDFGVAKDRARDDQITVSGAIVGSPAYMSPEQARAEPVDGRSDLWSFGAVLYRAITGHNAFAAGNTTDVLFNICGGAIPRASVANPELPEELDEFFERAFARNPAFRFASGMQMADEFCAIIEPKTVVSLTAPASSDAAIAVERARAGTATATATPLRDSSRVRSRVWTMLMTAVVALGFGSVLGYALAKREAAFGEQRALTMTTLAAMPVTATPPPATAGSPDVTALGPALARSADVSGLGPAIARAPNVATPPPALARSADVTALGPAIAPSADASALSAVAAPSVVAAVGYQTAAPASGGKPKPLDRGRDATGRKSSPHGPQSNVKVDPVFGLPLEN